MRCIGHVLLLAMCLAGLPRDLQAKGADGVVMLDGKIRDVQTQTDGITFKFTGELRFTFFNADDGASRKQVDLAFDVESLPVRIPDFGGHEFDDEDCPWRVSFKNATVNAQEAGRSGETATVMLVEPKISFDVNGVLERIDSARGQVLTYRLDHHHSDMEKRCRK